MKPIRFWKTIRAWLLSMLQPCAEELPQGPTPQTAWQPLEETGSMATASKPCPAPDVPRLPVLISTATSRLAVSFRQGCVDWDSQGETERMATRELVRL